MFRKTRKFIAIAVALSLISSYTGIVPISVSAENIETGSRIRVDINKNDGRKASYAKNANNWILVDGASPLYLHIIGVLMR